MNDFNERTHLLVGQQGLETLRRSHVLVAGVGGVGGACAEALGRAGVGTLTLIDFDRVAPSNCNRQVVALHSTLGRTKLEVIADRLRDINPEIRLNLITERIAAAEAARVVPEGLDALLDCIDALASKVALLKVAQDRGVFAATSMGAGARMDPSQVRIADLFETRICRMAIAMRKLARKNGVRPGIRAVYSEEPAMPHVPREWVPGEGPQKTVNGTISYMPGLFGLWLASEAIRHLLSPDRVAITEA